MTKRTTHARHLTARAGFAFRAVGVLLLGLTVALLDLLQELFVSVEVQQDVDRRLHDSDFSGDLNHRTGRLDAGTDPYGWYDE